jgi:predicted secreted acid phosphatase
MVGRQLQLALPRLQLAAFAPRVPKLCRGHGTHILDDRGYSGQTLDLTVVVDTGTTRSGAATKPAVVFDIDETALSNWDVLRRDDFGRPVSGPCTPSGDTPCGWAAWDQLGRDPAIEPTLDLYRAAAAANVAVFFITGRPESQRQATARNLEAVGYGGHKMLSMVPEGAHFASAVDFKTPVRAQIEKDGYTIIVNIGDQPSDLLGGHAEKCFLLPDPFYRVP